MFKPIVPRKKTPANAVLDMVSPPLCIEHRRKKKKEEKV